MAGISKSLDCQAEPNLLFWMILAGVGILSDVVITFINLHRKIKYSQDIEKDIEQTTKIKEEKTALLSIFQKSIRLSMFGL